MRLRFDCLLSECTSMLGVHVGVSDETICDGMQGCLYCGGLGHRIGNCPKLQSNNMAQERGKKDYFGAGGFGGEM